MDSTIDWLQKEILKPLPTLDFSPLPGKTVGKLKLSPEQLFIVIHAKALADWALTKTYPLMRPRLKHSLRRFNLLRMSMGGRRDQRWYPPKQSQKSIQRKMGRPQVLRSLAKAACLRVTNPLNIERVDTDGHGLTRGYGGSQAVQNLKRCTWQVHHMRISVD